MQDYEKYYTYSNSRTLILIVIGLWLVNMYAHPIDLIMKPQPVNISVNATPTPIIIYRNVTVTVTPTPDGKIYFASEYQDGIRKLGRLFSWMRYNALGNETMSSHVKVYDYRDFKSLHIFNPSDYKYYEVMPQEEDNRYIIIFVKIWLDDVTGSDMPLWLPNEQHYYLQSFNQVFTPVKWDRQLRIKELEDTFNDNRDSRIQYYGQYNVYTRDLRYKSTAGEKAEDIYWVMGGESNAVS